jgi:hypothetical protein
LRAAAAISNPIQLHRLRQHAMRNKNALQHACIDHVLTGAPLPLVQRTAKPHSVAVTATISWGTCCVHRPAWPVCRRGARRAPGALLSAARIC